MKILEAFIVVLFLAIVFGAGHIAGYDTMRHKCNAIVASRLPVPPVPIIYLSREE